MYRITAEQLIKFNEKAHEEKQNRILNIRDRYSDPAHRPHLVKMDMFCLVMPLLLHKNYKGLESLRCHITYGVEGQAEPATGLMDIPLCYKEECLKYVVDDKGQVLDAE